jgi:peptide/nickel transport system permease protein
VTPVLPFKPALLWTDLLLFGLVLALLLVVWYIRRHEHLAAPWRKVAMSRAGMVSATLLAVFATIGLLDSLHYRPALPDEAAAAVPAGKTAPGKAAPGKAAAGETRYAVELRSVLDLLLDPLPSQVETTYSAPLATRAFNKTAIEGDEGTVRDYPRLKYGGAHLVDDSSYGGDIATRAAGGALKGLGLGFAVLAVLALLLSPRRAVDRLTGWLAGNGEDAVHCAAWTLLVVAALGGALSGLAGAYHVFGTDKVGQDVLYQILKSIRTALVIGTLTTLVTLPIGVVLGIAAGYFRGWIDDLIQYLYTTLNSIPGVLLIAAAVLMTQVYMDTHPESFETVTARADFRLLFLCLILGITSWTGLARLLRGETLKLRELEYVQAAQAFGVSSWNILGRHILPNVMHIVLIALVMDFSGLVLAEAVLSYVGVGVDPSMISFGTMINSARLEMAREPMVWWALAAAFVFMFVLVLAANLFADAVRDALDPRTRVRGVA